MRPCEPALEASVMPLELVAPDSSAGGTFSGRGAAMDGTVDDFFRGGNPLSLAHESD
jgi:hypothetical protein